MAKRDSGEDMLGSPENQLTRRDLLKMGFSSAMVSTLMATAMYGCGGSGGGGSSPAGSGGSTVNVSGVMHDSDGTPVPGAQVTIQSAPVVVTTDASGFFSAEVPPGQHTINVTKEGNAIYNNTFTAVAGSSLSLGHLNPTPPYCLNDGLSVEKAKVIISGSTFSFSAIPNGSSRFCKYVASVNDTLIINISQCSSGISVQVTDSQNYVQDTFYPSSGELYQYRIYTAGTYYLVATNGATSPSSISYGFTVESGSTTTTTTTTLPPTSTTTTTTTTRPPTTTTTTTRPPTTTTTTRPAYYNYSNTYYNYYNTPSYYNYFVNSWG